jgi:hypothetical protein
MRIHFGGFVNGDGCKFTLKYDELAKVVADEKPWTV